MRDVKVGVASPGQLLVEAWSSVRVPVEHDGAISEQFQDQRFSSQPALGEERRPAVDCEAAAAWLLEGCAE